MNVVETDGAVAETSTNSAERLWKEEKSDRYIRRHLIGVGKSKAIGVGHVCDSGGC